MYVGFRVLCMHEDFGDLPLGYIGDYRAESFQASSGGYADIF